MMRFIGQLTHWGDSHHPKMLDIVRITLGLFLTAKGWVFFTHAAYLRDLIIENKTLGQSPDIITAIVYYTTYMHLLGGVLITLGLFTRLWALLQLPIVFGAIFFVNILSPFVNAELWLSVLVLMLLVLFVIIGSGPLSFDRLLSNAQGR